MLEVELPISIPPEHFDQPNQHNNTTPNPPDHPLSTQDITSSNRPFIVAQRVMAHLFQLESQCTSGRRHRMSSIRASSLTSIPPPDAPSIISMSTKDWSTGNKQQISKTR